MEWLSITRDIVVTVAAASGAIVAWLGLTVWRHELRGKEQHEVARRVLLDVLKVRDAFSVVRRGTVLEDEMRTALREMGREADRSERIEWTVDVEQAVLYYRWRTVSQSWVSLNASILEAEVYWGEDATNSLVTLREVTATLLSSIEYLMYLRSERGQRESGSDGAIKIGELRDVVWAPQPADRDLFRGEIDSAIVAAKTFLKPRLLVKEH